MYDSPPGKHTTRKTRESEFHLRVMLEEQALELCEALVLRGHNSRVRQRLTALVVDGEVLVELEQVHQLPVQLPCRYSPKP